MMAISQRTSQTILCSIASSILKMEIVYCPCTDLIVKFVPGVFEQHIENFTADSILKMPICLVLEGVPNVNGI